jgi:hypothetical protein
VPAARNSRNVVSVNPAWVTIQSGLGSWLWELVTGEITHHITDVVQQRSIAERFAIPHDFPPNLTFKEALIRVAGALTRICLGSLLFALWGVGSALAWTAIPNPFLKAAALLPLLILFLLALTGVLAGVTVAVKKLSPKPS